MARNFTRSRSGVASSSASSSTRSLNWSQESSRFVKSSGESSVGASGAAVTASIALTNGAASGKLPAFHQLEQDSLPQSSAGNPQRQLQHVRERLEHEDAGRQQAHALRVELEAPGHLRDGRQGEHANPAPQRLVRQL